MEERFDRTSYCTVTALNQYINCIPSMQHNSYPVSRLIQDTNRSGVLYIHYTWNICWWMKQCDIVMNTFCAQQSEGMDEAGELMVRLGSLCNSQ